MKYKYIGLIVLIVVTGTICCSADAQRRREKEVQDNILAPTRCILDSVVFQSREAAEAFAKDLAGAKVISSTRTIKTIRRGRGYETETSEERYQVDMVKYKGYDYQIYDDVWRWTFKRCH